MHWYGKSVENSTVHIRTFEVKSCIALKVAVLGKASVVIRDAAGMCFNIYNFQKKKNCPLEGI